MNESKMPWLPAIGVATAVVVMIAFALAAATAAAILVGAAGLAALLAVAWVVVRIPGLPGAAESAALWFASVPGWAQWAGPLVIVSSIVVVVLAREIRCGRI